MPKLTISRSSYGNISNIYLSILVDPSFSTSIDKFVVEPGTNGSLIFLKTIYGPETFTGTWFIQILPILSLIVNVKSKSSFSYTIPWIITGKLSETIEYGSIVPYKLIALPIVTCSDEEFNSATTPFAENLP